MTPRQAKKATKEHRAIFIASSVPTLPDYLQTEYYDCLTLIYDHPNLIGAYVAELLRKQVCKRGIVVANQHPFARPDS